MKTPHYLLILALILLGSKTQAQISNEELSKLKKSLDTVYIKLDSIENKLNFLVSKIDTTKKVDQSKENIQIVTLGLGGNLIFEGNKAKISGLHFDVNGFIPNLTSSQNDAAKFGVYARYSQGKILGGSDTIGTLTRYYKIDSENVLSQKFKQANNLENYYIAMNLSPTLQVIDDFYFILHFEYYRLQKSRETRHILLNQDTVDYSPEYHISRTLIDEEKTKISQTHHLFNYGIGLLLNKNVGDLKIHLKAVVGFGQTSYEQLYQSLGFFYNTHFEVTETKVGLKFGGEIRGLAFNNNRSNINSPMFTPFTNIYIAKTLSFSKLGEAIFGDSK